MFVSSSGGYKERSTDIKVDPFLDCMHFVVPIMKFRFYVIPKGTSFAYTLRLKYSFREASGYLLYNIRGTMMQMAKYFVPKFIDILTFTFSALVLNVAHSSTSSLYKFFT